MWKIYIKAKVYISLYENSQICMFTLLKQRVVGENLNTYHIVCFRSVGTAPYRNFLCRISEIK